MPYSQNHFTMNPFSPRLIYIFPYSACANTPICFFSYSKKVILYSCLILIFLFTPLFCLFPLSHYTIL
ncbi:hypothetical protein BDV25DRAFT_158189 [Aspergillus avenaceus]|uniref:Uncharacterized protein n=1 Tax=Aspergillus avenaceus TaxID=36643 RepID=A0A5N6TQQ5_ASPAV|nr:hypothetical protein BDV25DRAFT_158189 [Aspergillus avenaceus]